MTLSDKEVYRLLADNHENNPHLFRSKYINALKRAVRHTPWFLLNRHKLPKLDVVPVRVRFRINDLIADQTGYPRLTYFKESVRRPNDIDLSIPYFYVNLAYLFNGKKIAVRLFEKAYSELCRLFRDRPMKIYNQGPSLISGLLAYYCNLHEGSKYVFVQHAIYQQNRMPPYYEYAFKNTNSWLWGEVQAEAYRERGVEDIQIVPNIKIVSVAESASIDWRSPVSLVIVGESTDRFYRGYNTVFEKAMAGAIQNLREYSSLEIQNVFYKPHPRSRVKGTWQEVSDKQGWTYTEQFPDLSNVAVIGVFSTYLVEVLSKGIPGFQVQSDLVRSVVEYDDYTRYTSLISVPDKLTSEDQIKRFVSSLDRKIGESSTPHIEQRFLRIAHDWQEQYYERIVAT